MKPISVHPAAEPLWWTVVNAGWFSLTVGTAIGLAGLYAAWFTYVRTKTHPVIQVTADGFVVVAPVETPLAGQLEIRYNEVTVPRVTSSVVGIWNGGTTIFRSSDFVEKDPLRITVRGANILQASLEIVSRNVIGANIVTHDDHSVIVSFDFFEPNDAIAVRILHTGGVHDIAVQGTIIGLPKGLTLFSPARPKGFLQKHDDNIVLTIGGFMLLMFTILLWIKGGWQKGVVIPLGILGLILMSIAVITFENFVSNRWKRKVPKAILSNSQLRRRLELEKIVSGV